MNIRQKSIWTGILPIIGIWMLLLLAVGLIAWKQEQPEPPPPRPKYSLSLNRDNKHRQSWVTEQPSMPPEGWLLIIDTENDASEIWSPDGRMQLYQRKNKK